MGDEVPAPGARLAMFLLFGFPRFAPEQLLSAEQRQTLVALGDRLIFGEAVFALAARRDVGNGRFEDGDGIDVHNSHRLGGGSGIAAIPAWASIPPGGNNS